MTGTNSANGYEPLRSHGPFTLMSTEPNDIIKRCGTVRATTNEPPSASADEHDFQDGTGQCA